MTSKSDITSLYFVDDSDDEVFIAKLAFAQQNIALEIHHFFDLPTYFLFLDARSISDLTTSLTVLDLNLTVGRGTDGVSQIRAHPHFASHLVGICSGSDDPADRQAAYDAGALFFIGKPLNDKALVAICDAVDGVEIEMRDGSMHLVRQRTHS